MLFCNWTVKIGLETKAEKPVSTQNRLVLCLRATLQCTARSGMWLSWLAVMPGWRSKEEQAGGEWAAVTGGDLVATPVTCLAPPWEDKCLLRWSFQLLSTDHLLTVQVTAACLLYMGILLGAVDKVPASFCSQEKKQSSPWLFLHTCPNEHLMTQMCQDYGSCLSKRSVFYVSTHGSCEGVVSTFIS